MKDDFNPSNAVLKHTKEPYLFVIPNWNSSLIYCCWNQLKDKVDSSYADVYSTKYKIEKILIFMDADKITCGASSDDNEETYFAFKLGYLKIFKRLTMIKKICFFSN